MIDEEILRGLVIPEQVKREFPLGPWTAEDDLIIFASHGFTCIVIRAERGHLNGYVVIPDDHPWAAISSELDLDASDIEVHGGVSHARPAIWSKGNLVVGFDCAHAFDMAPCRHTSLMDKASSPALAMAYRDMAYVRRNVISLADSAWRAMPLFYGFEDSQVRELERFHKRLTQPISDAELLDEANKLKDAISETTLLKEGRTAEHMLHVNDREYILHLVEGLIQEVGTARPSGPDTNHAEEELEAILVKLK